jgi:hypothetical protein
MIFVFALLLLCLMMVCTIPYDRLLLPTHRTTELNDARSTTRKEQGNCAIDLQDQKEE